MLQKKVILFCSHLINFLEIWLLLKSSCISQWKKPFMSMMTVRDLEQVQTAFTEAGLDY